MTYWILVSNFNSFRVIEFAHGSFVYLRRFIRGRPQRQAYAPLLDSMFAGMVNDGRATGKACNFQGLLTCLYVGASKAKVI